MLKRFAALFLVVLMSIESFAAVVSDNDGAAFITKAEFDSLKNTFQSTLDGFNSSIDNKINSAVAQYLEGIKQKRRIKLDSELNAKGCLGSGKKVLWNSGTNSYFGFSKNENRLVLETVTIYFYGRGNGTTSPWFGNAYRWVNFYPDTAWYRDGRLPSDRKYLTSKKVQLKLDDGSTIANGFQRMKVACYLTWWYKEDQPNSTVTWGSANHLWTPGAGQSLGNHVSEVFQNTKNTEYDSASENYTAWRAAQSVTVDTHDIADDGEEYTWDELICPLSTHEELFWDPQKNDAPLSATSGNESRAYTTGINLNWTPINRSGVATYCKSDLRISPTLAGGFHAPWLAQKIRVQDMYLYSLNQSDNRNRQVKNGMLLGEINKKGDYRIIFESDEPGVFYAIISKTPISNWTSSSYSGESKVVASADTEYTMNINNVTVTDSLIWICYLPSDTTKNATLKIKEFSVETDE